MIAAGKRPARGVVGVRSAPAGLSAEGAGVCRWREGGEARVGPHLVKVPPPGFQLGAGVGEGAEKGRVQQLVAQLAVEALAEAVLLGLARGDVMPADLALVGPFQDGVGRQFRAVVADDRRRLAAPADDRVQRARDASPADRGVGHQRQTLAGAVVVHLQDPEPRPSVNWSATKSRLQRWLATAGVSIGRRVPMARLRPPRWRTLSRSSRYRR